MIDLKAIETYKVKVTMNGSRQVASISRLKYQTGQEVYILGKEQLEMLIKSNKDIDSKVVKALDNIANEIKCNR